MAKSIRSKSQKKNRALKRETIFKPANDSRLQRLAARDLLTQIDDDGMKTSPAPEDDTKASVMTIEQNISEGQQMSPSGVSNSRAKSKWRRNRKQSFSSYGLSAKEMRF